LRDYGTGTWEGGDPSCNHESIVRLGSGRADGIVKESSPRNRDGVSGIEKMKLCVCGAHRNDEQVGLEKTPQEYVGKLVKVFAEVHRVLRPDGTLWLNLGDSYARDARKGQHKPGDSGKHGYIYDQGGGRASACVDLQSESRGSSDGKVGRGDHAPVRNGAIGLKAKDLIGIPWMVAFALRASGWYLRQDIIWSKPNPMPESVTDRCTKAHEYLFLLSKNEQYYFDADAIKERSLVDKVTGGFFKDTTPKSFKGSQFNTGKTGGHQLGRASAKPRTVDGDIAETRNKRSVWTVATVPYKEAHFATFPETLVEPCIRAGCPILHRNCVGIELNSEYAKMALNRINAKGGFFYKAEVI